jgi:chloramphenicol-sensitive protein RarD
MNPGIAYALAAYLAWGLLPLYLHRLAPVSATEIMAHRIVWSLVTIAMLLLALGRLSWLRAVAAQPATLLRYLGTASLISLNWLVYTWAINTGHVVDASLGYFINPLLNVLLGALFFHERLRLGQKLPIALTALGVAWLTWQAGAPPWIGLVLALSFSSYGLLRKTGQLGAIEGFTLEVALLAPMALGYLLWRASSGTLAFANDGTPMRWMLAAAGPLTTIPMLLFAAGARRISFSLLGVLQYLSPTLQWVVGVYVFDEPFDPRKAIGFGIIWAALLLFAAEGAWAGWQRARYAGARPAAAAGG